MKKLISIICIATLIFINFMNITYADANINIKAPTMAAKDQEFKITIDSDLELLGTNFIFTFDESAIEYVRIEAGKDEDQEEGETQEGGMNIANLTAPGELNVAFINIEPLEEPYTVVFKALKENETTQIKVSKLNIIINDETAEQGMKEERNIKVEDIKIKLVNKSELIEGDNIQTVGRTNSLYIFIAIGAVAIIAIAVILILKKKK